MEIGVSEAAWALRGALDHILADYGSKVTDIYSDGNSEFTYSITRIPHMYLQDVTVDVNALVASIVRGDNERPSTNYVSVEVRRDSITLKANLFKTLVELLSQYARVAPVYTSWD